MPAIVASVNREARTARIRIPGLTDGATELPEAEFCNPLGDKSEHTEIRIKEGDRVWLAFNGGDPRYPVIVGYRPKNVENGIDWRRFEHGNFQFNADNTFEVIAGTTVHVKSPSVTIEADETHVTGALTVDKLLTFKGGMNGSGGGSGGPAMVVSGGAAFSEDVVAAGTSVHGHGHIEQGDGARVSNPVA
ncbi:phage baseplate assembly protein V [Burkholderia cenocepacia]|uniref:phage baseplate assembly protein V n=1 Tax=Burkholderia cenocepacia TaxID=95486 RepID=UPI0023B97BF2|nr:phage baseplate assembly protein V [Burkholderia cenocepacia]MDF0506604.1 phage baseplate assembly protein V [Burkholderia cenocepacia]